MCPADAEGGQRRLHAGGWVAQQCQILERADRVADGELDTVAREYPRVLPRDPLVARPRRGGRDNETTRRQRIDEAEDGVENGQHDCRRGEHDRCRFYEPTPHGCLQLLTWAIVAGDTGLARVLYSEWAA